MSGFPVKMSVRVEFSDGTVHEYEVGNLQALSANEIRAGAGLPPPKPPWSLTPLEAERVALYGICERCGGPRDVLSDDLPEGGRVADLYCPACASR